MKNINFVIAVFITSIVFATIGITSGKIIEDIFPKFDPKRGKLSLYIESMLQIGIIAVITYAFRLLTGYLTRTVFKTKAYGPADKFAVLVVAPTMFSQMTDLTNKIKYVWDN